MAHEDHTTRPLVAPVLMPMFSVNRAALSIPHGSPIVHPPDDLGLRRYIPQTAKLLALAWLLIFCWTIRSAALEIENWSHYCPILVDTPPKGAVTEVPLTAAVFDAARSDLGDLRVVSVRHENIPYALRPISRGEYRTTFDVRLLNRSFIPGRQSSVIVDFGRRRGKNRVMVITYGASFRRRVRIEASNNRKEWTVIRDSAYLFRVADDRRDKVLYDKSTIEFPQDNHQYLRITVFNGPDDPGAVEIQDVLAWRYVRVTPETVPVDVISTASRSSADVTEIEVDLGFRNLPLHEIELQFSDTYFYRMVTVLGRNRKAMPPDRGTDNEAANDVTPVPWTQITEGKIFRFFGEDWTEQSVTIDLHDGKYRYLLIRIHDRGRDPLHFTGARVTRFQRNLWLTLPKGSPSCRLYFGNPEADAPEYNTGDYIELLKRDQIVQATLGPAQKNPMHQQIMRVLPWNEQHKWLIWAVFLALALALAFVIYRVSRNVPKDDV